MMTLVGGVCSGIQRDWSPPLCTRLCRVADTIGQLVIPLLFIGASILTAALACPAVIHAVILPLVAIGASALAAFFFSKRSSIHQILFAPPSSPVAPIELVNGKMPEGIPADAPRGFYNQSNNCALNAILQMANRDPGLARWMREPLDDQVPILNNNLLILKQTLHAFYEANDKAVAEGLGQSQGNSQDVRNALHLISNHAIPASPAAQIDAMEALEYVLTLAPDSLKSRIETTYTFSPEVQRILPMDQLPASKVERVGFLSLPLEKNGDQTPTLEWLFDRYRDNPNAEPQRRYDQNGVSCDYPVDNVHIDLIDPPPALRFHIKRFTQQRTLGVWHTVKLHTPVESPQQFTVNLKDGRQQTYRLSAFVEHHGEYGGGHYTSNCIGSDGTKYIMNDSRISRMDPNNPKHQEAWKKSLEQAYLLCYVPV